MIPGQVDFRTRLPPKFEGLSTNIRRLVAKSSHMVRDIGRYYMSSDEYHKEVVGNGFRWLLDSSSEILVVYVPYSMQLTDGSYIVSVIGHELASELDKNFMISFNNKTIHLITTNKMPRKDGTLRLLAIWPDSNILVEIEKRYKITNMLVIPWNQNDIQEWQDKYHPIQLSNCVKG